MESTACGTRQVSGHPTGLDAERVTPFSRQWVTISKEEHIALIHRANYWEAQYLGLKRKFAKQEEENQRKDAKLKDLRNRLFGKTSEKQGSGKSSRGERPSSGRKRGQQPGCAGHGRTPRPALPVVTQVRDVAEDEKRCPHCGLPYVPAPALDEHDEFIEVEVQAYTRRRRRRAYLRNRHCDCPGTPAVLGAPPAPRLIRRSPYQVSFWVEVLLSKFHYAQPTHRYLQALRDRALPVSPGTVAGGLQAIAPLFEPILEGLYQQQMTETLFHNDETRWEVFVPREGKVGSRWYLWVTRSHSVVFFLLDPGRSAAVPGAHFAGLQAERAIIVCDRYSAYKKLARLSDAIELAFCWAHVRRDFLDAGRGYPALAARALAWKARIGALYHRNRLRRAHWDGDRALERQSEAFQTTHQAVRETLQAMHEEATRLSATDEETLDKETRSLPASARQQQRKVCASLLNHRVGLTRFVDDPRIPLDDNPAENTIRGPVTGRKNYYGSGRLWSAELAATLFSILKTLELWGINPRHWLTAYLNACAENAGKAPVDLGAYLPRAMDTPRLRELARAPPARLSPSPPSMETP